jgi:hypothetical protein
VDAQPPRSPSPPQPPKPPKWGEGKEQKGGGDDTPTRGLPRCVLLTKDGREISGYSVEKWPDDFTETDGGDIKELREEVVYKINYDNAYAITGQGFAYPELKTFAKTARNDVGATQTPYTSMSVNLTRALLRRSKRHAR